MEDRSVEREDSCRKRRDSAEFVSVFALGAILVSALTCLTGCSVTARQYFKNRGHDVLDIIDYDYGVGPGLAARVEVTHAVVASLGFMGGSETHKRGREIDNYPGAGMGSFGVFSVEGTNPHNLDVYVAGINMALLGLAETAEPTRNWFRVGPKVCIGYVTGGIYLNLAELADLFGGIVGFDMMGDDAPPEPEAIIDEAFEGRGLAQHLLPAPTNCTVFVLQADDSSIREFERRLVTEGIREHAATDQVGLVWLDGLHVSKFPQDGAPLSCTEPGKAALIGALNSISTGVITDGIEVAIDMIKASGAPIGWRRSIVVITNGGLESRKIIGMSERAAELSRLNGAQSAIHVVFFGVGNLHIASFLQGFALQNGGTFKWVNLETLKQKNRVLEK